MFCTDISDYHSTRVASIGLPGLPGKERGQGSMFQKIVVFFSCNKEQTERLCIWVRTATENVRLLFILISYHLTH
jgi:hypothetical protein